MGVQIMCKNKPPNCGETASLAGSLNGREGEGRDVAK